MFVCLRLCDPEGIHTGGELFWVPRFGVSAALRCVLRARCLALRRMLYVRWGFPRVLSPNQGPTTTVPTIPWFYQFLANPISPIFYQ
jgi:hypothetical protein